MESYVGSFSDSRSFFASIFEPFRSFLEFGTQLVLIITCLFFLSKNSEFLDYKYRMTESGVFKIFVDLSAVTRWIVVRPI